MKITIVVVLFMFVIIIVSLTGASFRQDTCSFDHGLCGWIQEQSDDFNWTRQSGATPTINTGPKSGHTTGNDTDDYYMYINALHQQKGKRAVLRYIGFDHPGRACLSFWYHMYGEHVGTMNINVRRNGDSPVLVWSKTENQSTNWTEAAIDLAVDSKVILEFEAIRGNGHFGDMALDDVSLTCRSCFNCAFDDDTCLWKENTEWKLFRDEAKKGMYVTLDVSKGCAVHSGYSFWTPVSAMQGPVCVSFLYFLNGSDNRLRLYMNSPSNDSVIWKGNGNSSSNWNIVSTFVNESFPNFTLVFEMYPGPSCLGEVRLENVSVVMGKCQVSNTEVKSITLCLTGSTVRNKTTYPHLNASEFQTTSSADLIHETHYIKISVAAIIGSVVGPLAFVVVLVFVAVCIYRKRRQRGKKADFIEFQTISSKMSGREGKVENYPDAEHSINTGCTYGSNISHTDDIAEVNVKVAIENCKYVASSVTKPAHGTDDTYDTTCDEKRSCLDGTYDHVTTHYNDLCDKTYVSENVSRSNSDVNQVYDHVTKSPDGVFDETYATTSSWSR